VRTLFAGVIATVFASTLSPLPAAAKTISLPDDAEVMRAYLPDSWKPSDTNSGVEAQSPDSDVYVSIEYAKNAGKGLESVMRANGEWMRKSKIVPDSPQTHDQNLTINGMSVHEIKYDAHDKDGATNVIFTLYELPQGALAIVTVWGSAKERAAHDDQIQKIMASVKPIQ
jgi:hypothetical protein